MHSTLRSQLEIESSQKQLPENIARALYNINNYVRHQFARQLFCEKFRNLGTSLRISENI